MSLQSQSTLQILIIDNATDDVEHIKQLFGEIDSAFVPETIEFVHKSSPEAAKEVETNDIDLVVVALNLVETQGIETLEIIQSDLE
ncbi:MAG: hypothetical protein ABEI86_03335, partial [Halobacteriaceae archaeon]